MAIDILDVVMRYLHIGSAVVAVGGMAFILLCLSPAIRLLDDNLRQSVTQLALGRFHRVLYVCIAGLVISGVWGWMTLNGEYNRIRPWGQALIGTKVLLAVIMFALVFARAAGLVQFRKPRTLPMINIHLAALVMLLGAILRHLRGL